MRRNPAPGIRCIRTPLRARVVAYKDVTLQVLFYTLPPNLSGVLPKVSDYRAASQEPVLVLPATCQCPALPPEALPLNLANFLKFS